MQKEIDYKIGDTYFKFLISTAMTINDEAVHVNVVVNKEYEESFLMIPNHSEILRNIAEKEALSINPKAFLRLNPINKGYEWQGQFDFIHT